MDKTALIGIGAAAVGLYVLYRWKNAPAGVTVPGAVLGGGFGWATTPGQVANSAATGARIVSRFPVALDGMDILPGPVATPAAPAFVVGAPGGTAVTGWDGVDPGFAYAGGIAPAWWANAHGTYNDPRGNNYHPAR